MNRHGIDLAIEHIDQQWRTTLYRAPLITALTALDWQARNLDDDLPAGELISRIGALRSRIWLSSET